MCCKPVSKIYLTVTSIFKWVIITCCDIFFKLTSFVLTELKFWCRKCRPEAHILTHVALEIIQFLTFDKHVKYMSIYECQVRKMSKFNRVRQNHVSAPGFMPVIQRQVSVLAVLEFPSDMRVSRHQGWYWGTSKTSFWFWSSAGKPYF